jgi:hypothetical protein
VNWTLWFHLLQCNQIHSKWTICDVCCGTYCIKLQLDIKLWKAQSTSYANNQLWKTQFKTENPLIDKQFIKRNNYWCFELDAHLNPNDNSFSWSTWNFSFMLFACYAFVHSSLNINGTLWCPHVTVILLMGRRRRRGGGGEEYTIFWGVFFFCM